MPDQLFFKNVAPRQWLCLRLPSGFRVAIDDQGAARASEPPRYDPATSLPAGIGAVAWLTAAADGQRLQVSSGPAPATLGEPFAQLRTLTPVPTTLLEQAGSLAASPALPLQMYWAYRNAPVDANRQDPHKYLTRLLGVHEDAVRLEALSGLLFLVDCPEGSIVADAPLAGIHADSPLTAATAPQRLTLTAGQTARGVELRIAGAHAPLSNAGVLEFICGSSTPPFAPSYQWERMLGLGGRGATTPGPVFLPTTLADPARAAAPLTIVDPLRPAELVGELLNYELRLINPHGRCTHLGRVILKRERLDRPSAPALAWLVLRRPAEQHATHARCTLGYAISAEHVEEIRQGQAFELVLYRFDFPVVPTGFYGDEDDQSLLIARRMADLDTAFSSQAEYGGLQPEQQASASGDVNLSNHNLIFASALPVQAQPQQSVDIDLEFHAGGATQFFVALRRKTANTDGPSANDMPESSVVTVEHRLALEAAPGETPEQLHAAARLVPHIEPFWRAQDALPALLGDGAGRVIAVSGPALEDGSSAEPAKVCVIVQHKRAHAAPGGAIVGGYRLWVRDLLMPGSDTRFAAVALVQALPPLIKAYAPLESGRKWLRVRPSAMGALETARLEYAEPREPDFLPAQAVASAVLGSSQEALAKAVAEARSALESRSLDAAAFNSAAGTAAQALSTPSLDLAKVMAALARHDLDDHEHHHTLAAVLALKDAGLAQEFILSVRLRQRLQHQDMVRFAGHWLFFQDQNGAYLGRAFHFWLPDGQDRTPFAEIRRFYTLREAPATHDAIGIDDFGRITWTWNGIRDRWRHELEWLIEPVSRYAPLCGVRAVLGVETPPAWTRPGELHRLSVQRSAPLEARINMAQSFPVAALDDHYRIRLQAPAEFRHALHNAAARTRLGVLRVAPAVQSVLIDEPTFTAASVEPLRRFLASAGDADAPAPAALEAAAPGDLGAPGELGELLIDEAPWASVTVTVQARADAVTGPRTTLGPLQRAPRAIALPTAAVPTIGAHGAGRRLRIPLARLGWSYGGQRRAPIRAYFTPSVAPAAFLTEFGHHPATALPDPYVEFMLFVRRDGIARPALLYRGPSSRFATTPDVTGLQAGPALDWGSVLLDPALLHTPILQGDELQLDLPDWTIPLWYQWRVQGKATDWTQLNP